MLASAVREITAREILKNLHPLDLRNLAKYREITTPFMAAAYIHRVRSRSAAAVRISSANQWTAADHATVDTVYRLLTSQRLVQQDLQIGAGDPSFHLRLYVPLYHADLAHMASRAFLPAVDAARNLRADITAIVLPDWSETRSVLIDTDTSTVYVLGSDYYGDIHNSVLRLAAHLARRQGRLCLHAASAELWARSRKSDQTNHCGLLIFGPGGAGKTTLATHGYGLDASAGEKATVRQDDRVILHPSGLLQGTEGKGLYVRTLGVNAQDHPNLWPACNHEDAVLENVWTNPDGSVDFRSDALTPNGRAIVPITTIGGADGQIDVPRCTHVFFLVRDERMPLAARLSPAQAACFFLQAEAAEAHGPAAVPQPAWGADQASLQVDHANAFFDFLLHSPHVLCFALSTGHLGTGDKARKITLADTATVVREIARESIRWQKGAYYPFEVPAEVPGLDLAWFDPEGLTGRDALARTTQQARQDRQAWLQQLPGLRDEIKQAAC